MGKQELFDLVYGHNKIPQKRIVCFAAELTDTSSFLMDRAFICFWIRNVEKSMRFHNLIL